MILTALASIVLPIVVFLGGAAVMQRLVGRSTATRLLEERAKPEERKPLYSRPGYDVAAVDRYWSALGDDGRRIEHHFLQIDLAFPFIYGAALAYGLWLDWAALERPFHIGWLLAPVVITMVADWTENTVQLSQMHRYTEMGRSGLDVNATRIASGATLVKLIVFTIAFAMIVYLAGWVIVRAL